MPDQELRMIPITWPFAVWGLHMVEPFKRSEEKKTHLLVAVDKFTKWVEAELVSKCDAATAVQFMKKVIFRFGFPHNIITDNGIFFNVSIFGLMFHQWLTPSPMVKLREPIRKF